jgi:hypothetical protein
MTFVLILFIIVVILGAVSGGLTGYTEENKR